MLLHAERLPIQSAREPFERLFLREYPRCVAIARRFVFDPHMAEDVAQEAFVAFVRRYEAGTPFAEAWLHRATIHSAFNALRATRRRLARERNSATLDAPLREADASNADPLRATLRKEEQRTVRAALERLPARSRAVLALRHAGLSYGETAAALGVKANQVGTLIVRAEAAFTKEISRVPSH